MIGLHLLFGLLKPLSLMDILFPSFCSWKYTSLVTVDFYDFFSPPQPCKYLRPWLYRMYYIRMLIPNEGTSQHRRQHEIKITQEAPKDGDVWTRLHSTWDFFFSFMEGWCLIVQTQEIRRMFGMLLMADHGVARRCTCLDRWPIATNSMQGVSFMSF